MLTKNSKPPRQVPMAGTFKVTPGINFHFWSPFFSKCRTESCSPSSKREADTVLGFPQRFGEKKGNTRGKFLGDNPAAHCFVLRNLVPATAENFWRKNTFFLMRGLWSREGRMGRSLGVISNESKRFKTSRWIPSSSSLKMISWSPHKKNPEKWPWFA